MGKALIIKNANFSTNAVTTVNFDEEIPCTAVAWNSSSVTLTSLGIANVPYTLTPSNTTDEPTITSSDSSVVTVNGGVITAVGIGAATLTLSCNSHTDTCAVTVNISESLDYIIGFSEVKTDPSDANVSGVTYDGSSSSRITCGKDALLELFENPIMYINKKFDYNITPIRIPNNAAKIHIHATYLYDSSNSHAIYFINEEQRFVNAGKTYSVYSDKIYITPVYTSGTRIIDEDVNIPSGAIGYFVEFRPQSSSGLESITSESEAKTYADEQMAISVSYLTGN